MPDSKPGDDRPLMLSKDRVYMSLGLVIGLTGGGMFIGSGINAMSARLGGVEHRLGRVETAVEIGTAQRWKRTDMAQYGHTAEQLNPGWVAPIVVEDP